MEKIDQKSYLIAVFLFLSVSFLLFFRLGETHLTNWDEAWYADISRNMAQSGNLITPIWNKMPFFDKPPLYFWLSALAFKFFGVNEFSARLISAIAGIGVVFTLYALARVLFTKTTALLSVAILASTIGFLYRTRSGNLDTLLTFFLLFSIFSFYKGCVKNSGKWFLYMGVSAGLAFLTKGAIAFFFPFLALSYLFVKREYKILISAVLWKGFLLGIFISLSWFFASLMINGKDFINAFLLNQAGKFTTNFSFWEHFSLDYILYLKSGLKIWFIFFIPALFWTFFAWRNTKKILLFLYFFLIFIFLSFFESKSNWFLIPLYPICSLLIADTIYMFAKAFLEKRILISLLGIVGFLALLQIIFYRTEYIVADIAQDEANVASWANKLTKSDDTLYLTNYYYPTTVFYSQRKTYAVYSEHELNSSWWIMPKTAWSDILKHERVFIITTQEEKEQLKDYFSNYRFEIMYQSGKKMLLKKV